MRLQVDWFSGGAAPPVFFSYQEVLDDEHLCCCGQAIATDYARGSAKWSAVDMTNGT
jgi:hypothetical protein